MEHLTNETINKFIKGEYLYPQLLEISAHLLDCQQICQERLNQIDSSFLEQAVKLENARIKEEDQTTHFEDDEIEAYIIKKYGIEKRRKMNLHLTKCRICSTKLKERDPNYLSNFIKDNLKRDHLPEILLKGEEEKLNLTVLLSAPAFSVLLIVFLASIFMLPNNQNIDRAGLKELPSPITLTTTEQLNLENKNPANTENSNKIRTEVLSNSNNEQRNSKPGSKLGGQSKTSNASIIPKLPKKNQTNHHEIIVKDRSLDKNCDNNPVLAVSPKDEIIIDTQPNLIWKPLVGAASYKIYVSDLQNNLIEESNLPDAQKTSYKLTKQLELNKKYEWKVVVTLADGKEVYSEPAYFSVGEKAKKLSRSKERLKISEVRCLKSQN